MTTVEVLYFAGCPNGQSAVDRVRDIVDASDHGDVNLVETLVAVDDVARLHFLGSPSVRVNGQDVEPGAGRRTDFGYSCRRYQTPAGALGVPLDDWIRVALQEATGPAPLPARGRDAGARSPRR